VSRENESARKSYALSYCPPAGAGLNGESVPLSDVSVRDWLREQKAWNSLDQLIRLCDEQRRHFVPERLGES
jgi:hypothetical protein